MSKTKEPQIDPHIAALLSDKRYKDTHLNSSEKVKWICPTGSVKLDIFLDGGVRPGFFRIIAEPEHGKTSFALHLGRIFQKNVEGGFVFYVNAEGRGANLIDRSGIDTSPSKFFQLDTNIFETAYGMIRDLIEKNAAEGTGRKYMFIVDSMDSLNLKDDVDKNFESADKMAGGALLTSVMGRKSSLPLTKFGHILIALSQTRANVDTKGHGGPKTTTSGGKAIQFYSSLIAEVRPLWTDLYIWENPSATSIKEKGKRLGHRMTLLFKKTMNEKTGEELEVPIRYNSPPGEAIWKEYECFDLCVTYELINKNSSWFEIDKSLQTEFGMPEKLQGERKILSWFTEHPKEVDLILQRFRSQISE